jgi:hypothetical protein
MALLVSTLWNCILLLVRFPNFSTTFSNVLRNQRQGRGDLLIMPSFHQGRLGKLLDIK